MRVRNLRPTSVIVALITAAGAIIAALITSRAVKSNATASPVPVAKGDQPQAATLVINSRVWFGIVLFGLGAYFLAKGVWEAIEFQEWAPFLVQGGFGAVIFALGYLIRGKERSLFVSRPTVG